MPTPNPPSSFWSLVQDPAIQQDGTYRFSSSDRSYIDSQILALEHWCGIAYALAIAIPSITPLAAFRVTFGATNPNGTQLVCNGQDQEIFADQTAGQGTYPAPILSAAGPLLDGQRFSITDTASSGSWATHPAKISVTGGTKIELPAALGTFSTSSATMEAVNGNSATFVYGATENTWFIK